jgi:hypothetical protein
MILVKENSPNPESLGTSNGIVQFAMCCSRAIAPAFVRSVSLVSVYYMELTCAISSCFALSLDYNLLGGYLWVVIMAVMSYVGAYLTKDIVRQRKMR